MAFTLVTVTASYQKEDGTAESGTVTFQATAPMANGGQIREPTLITAGLVAGAISVVLPATDDAGTLPSGVTYTVIERISGAPDRVWQLAVPHTPTTLDLSTVAPALAPSAAYAYASDTLVVHLAGAETITGAKRITAPLSGPLYDKGGAVRNLLHPDYALPLDGTSDCGPALRAALNDLPLTNLQAGGTIKLPDIPMTFTSAVPIPARMSVIFQGDGSQSTYQGLGYKGGSLVLANGALSNQPAGLPGAMTLRTLFSQINSAGGGDVIFRDITFAYTGAFGTALISGGSIDRFILEDCVIQSLAVGYFWATASQYQPDQFTIDRNLIDTGFQNGIYWDGTGPFLGLVRANYWKGNGAPGNGINNSPGSVLYANAFWDFEICDNVFQQNNNKNGSGIGAEIYLATGAPNIDVSGLWMHDNLFTGCADAGVYLKLQAVGDNSHFWEGYRIHDNTFNDWGHQNVGGGYKSALYVDNPSYDVSIGQNTYYGGANSSFGINIVGDPNIQNITLDPRQNMRFVATAPYRINGVNYTTGAGATLNRFRSPVTLPAFPATTTTWTNNLGVDVAASITNGTNALTVALDNTTQKVIPANQTDLLIIPAGAAFKPTFGGGAPTWVGYGF